MTNNQPSNPFDSKWISQKIDLEKASPDEWAVIAAGVLYLRYKAMTSSAAGQVIAESGLYLQAIDEWRKQHPGVVDLFDEMVRRVNACYDAKKPAPDFCLPSIQYAFQEIEGMVNGI